MPNISTRSVYTKDAGICKVRINVDMTIPESAIQQAFVSLNTAVNGTLQLGVRQEYLTRYLSLEYGVAGYAYPEKALFGTVATEVRIPARRPYQAWKGGKLTNILVYYTSRGEQRMLFQQGDNPIIKSYTGVAPKGMVRMIIPELRRRLSEIPAKVLNERFGSGSVPIKLNKNKDSVLEELHRREMNILGEWLIARVRNDTPISIRTPERTAQLMRWNTNYPMEQRSLGHLATDGYFFEVVRK